LDAVDDDDHAVCRSRESSSTARASLGVWKFRNRQLLSYRSTEQMRRPATNARTNLALSCVLGANKPLVRNVNDVCCAVDCKLDLLRSRTHAGEGDSPTRLSVGGLLRVSVYTRECVVVVDGSIAVAAACARITCRVGHTRSWNVRDLDEPDQWRKKTS
jgi:hypothetical protein